MCFRILLNCGFFNLHKLYPNMHCGNLLFFRFHSLHKLRSRQVQCDYGGEKLHFMLGWDLPFLFRLKLLHSMPSGQVLCVDGTDGCLGSVRCGKIFGHIG